MRAVTVTGSSGRRQLAIEEHSEPKPGPDETVVAVKAFSLNNGEVREALDASSGHRPGWDFAGVVQKNLPQSGLSVGDRVVGLKLGGAWAERISVPAISLAPIPDGVGFEAAAVLPVAGMTAAIALSKKPIAHGSSVLITAATGGVGLFAVQLAAATGARVTALVRNEDDGPLLRRLGAHAVAVGLDEAADLGRYDLVLEGIGGKTLGHALSWLAPRGMCVQFGDASGDEPTTFDATLFRLGTGEAFGSTTLYGFFLAEELTHPENDAPRLLADLAKRLATGALDPMIQRVSSWHAIDETARLLMSRAFKGKAVLRID